MQPRHTWLLDVTVAGQQWRYSVDGEAVETAAGDTWTYRSGLGDMELASPAEVDIEVTDAALDAPRIAPRLEGVSCALRRWRVGTLFESAEVVARGTATSAEWESRNDPIRFTLRPVETLPPMPEPECRVTASTTKPDAADPATYIVPPDQSELYYPTIFGRPGQRIFFVGSPPVALPFAEYVVPCPMRKLFTNALANANSEIVISSDPTLFVPDRIGMREDRSEIVAQQDPSHPTEGLLCKVTTDDLGRAITVATLSNPRVRPLTNDGPVYLASVDDFLTGTLPPREAYDVIAYVLERWGGDTFDRSRLPEIRDHLRGYLVDTWIVEAPDGGVYGWLVDALGVGDVDSSEAAGLPIAIRMGPNGRYFVPLRYAVDPARTSRTLDTRRGEVVRESSLRAEDEPVNDVAATYAGDRAYPTWVGASISGTLVSQDAAFQSVTDDTGLAAKSLARYGRRSAEIEVPWTWDPATAARVGLDVLARLALPWRRVAYRVPEVWGVREGEQVRIVDPEVALDELAIVDAPPLVGSSKGVLVVLRLPGVP